MMENTLNIYIAIPRSYKPRETDRIENTFFGKGTIQAVERVHNDWKVTVKFDAVVGEKKLMWSYAIAGGNTRVLASDMATLPILRRLANEQKLASESDDSQIEKLIDRSLRTFEENFGSSEVDGLHEVIGELRARHGSVLLNFQVRLEYIMRVASECPDSCVNTFLLRTVGAIEAHPELTSFKRAIASIKNQQCNQAQ